MLPLCRGDRFAFNIVNTGMMGLAATAAWMRRLGRAFESAVFPYQCFGCNRFFFPEQNAFIPVEASDSVSAGGQFRELFGSSLCKRCKHAITVLESPLCRRCGIPFNRLQPVPKEDHTCGACLTSPQRFDLARACGPYDEGLKALIHRFKYHNLPHLARPLGSLLAWGLKTYYKAQPIDMIIPVPLHPRRMRSRGFNQAYLLAHRALSDSVNRPAPNACLVTTLLIRTRDTRPQTGLGRELRRKNIRNAFEVTNADAAGGKSILLVDDVFTTGATVDECARVLKQAGAHWVAVLSLARAV